MHKKVYSFYLLIIVLFLSWFSIAAPTIVTPNDYAVVPVLTDTMKGYLSDSEFLKTSTSYFSEKDTDKRREYKYEYTSNNSVPVTLTWSGTSGECIVKLWRTNKDTEAKPLFTKTVAGNSLKCFDLEVGRNYSWSVTDDTGSIIGHFFTEGIAPRIIRSIKDPSLKGADCSNGRDIGGWLTLDGKKRVKQGLIYRSAYIEYCSPSGEEIYMPIEYLKDTLGIKLDLDLRTIDNIRMYKDWPCTWDTNDGVMDGDEILIRSSIGPGVVRCCIEKETAGIGPNGNGIEFPNHTSFTSTFKNAKDETQSLKQNKIAVWTAFNKIYESAIVKGESVLFHCYQGKDRTGSLAFLIHGLLGVSQTDAKKDYGTALFCNDDATMTYTKINNLHDKLVSYDTAETKTFQGGCEQYLISCGTEAGDSDAAEKVSRFKIGMLEDVELALVPEGDNENETDDDEYEEPVVIIPAIESDLGYVKTGLGKNGNEVAIVFTNDTKTLEWNVPEDIENIQFLVVGGGGGGGADNYASDARQGGAGGGGGGVITGTVAKLDKECKVTITIGGGGSGGTASKTKGGKYGAGVQGGNSIINIYNTDIVVANGGGCDKGTDSKTGTTNGQNGGSGGSGGGGRPNKTGGAANPGTVVESYLLNYQMFGNKGGDGCTIANGEYGYGAAGGGGGATEVGGNGTKVDEYKGGDGGEGLISDITGVRLVYGSGGGGSSTWGGAGIGGEGAGDGVYGGNGKPGIANQGGGGGGGSRTFNGGAGGSGIVVLRYAIPGYLDVAFPEVTDDSKVAAALEGSADAKLVENIKTAAEYAAFREWAFGLEEATPEEVKASPNAWLSYALNANSLIVAALKEGDLVIDGFTQDSSTKAFDLFVSIKGIMIGDDAIAENFEKVFIVEGAEALKEGDFNKENVDIEFRNPEGGKVKVKATPKDLAAKRFFMRIKMK